MSKIMKYMEMPISASKKLIFSVYHNESVSTELIDCYTAFYTRTPKIKLRCWQDINLAKEAAWRWCGTSRELVKEKLKLPYITIQSIFSLGLLGTDGFFWLTSYSCHLEYELFTVRVFNMIHLFGSSMEYLITS